MMRFVFAPLVLLSAMAILGHWVKFEFSPADKARPPGPEWFTVQRELYRQHPWLTQTHLISSLLFITLSSFQFSASYRKKHLKWHRRMGRLFLGLTPFVAGSGLMLGVVIPRNMGPGPYGFTEYFEKEVLRKRPYLKKEWWVRVIEKSLKVETQEHNRFRFWGVIPELEDRILRVVTLSENKKCLKCA